MASMRCMYGTAAEMQQVLCLLIGVGCSPQRLLHQALVQAAIDSSSTVDAAASGNTGPTADAQQQLYPVS